MATTSAFTVPRQRTPRHTPDTGDMLLCRLAELPDGHPDRRRVRDRAIRRYLPLATHLANRFGGRGEHADDLAQVATLGLIKAVDGYDPARGVEFTSYAVPTVVGELKRYFRDHCWSVHVPRRLQELKQTVGAAAGPLSQRLGRSATVADLADHLGLSEDEVLDGLDSAQAYRAVSLSAPVATETGTGTVVQDLLGDDDPEMSTVEDRETLRPALERLPERERTIVVLRFFGNLTQSQIAERVGISQMHVSRLLSRSLTRLRQTVDRGT